MPTDAEQKQQGATVRDSRDYENAEPPRIKTHLRINTGAKSPVEKFPQPRINFSERSGSSPDNVRRQYLKQLGYTPLHFLKEDSPSCRTRKSFYDPNMTPTAEGGGNFYNPAMTPTTEERTIITTTQKKYGATGDAKQNAIVKSKLSDVPEDTVNASRGVSTTLKGVFRAGGTVASTCALMGATIGGGALALPYSFKLCGALSGTAVLVASGLLCVYTIRLLIHCRDRVQLCSYEDLSHYCFGKRFAQFVDLNILLFCFGTCVAYLIAIGDIIVPIVKEISRGTSYELLATRPILVAFVAIFCMCPISLVDTVTELRWANIFGICVFGTLVLSMCYRAIASIARGDNVHEQLPVSEFVGGTGSVWGVFYSLPTIVYAFCCHVNVFSIFTALHRPTIRRMNRVAYGACTIAVVLYLVLAYAGLSEYGRELQEDILSNLGHRTVVTGMIQLLMAVNIGLCFPMNVYPSRFTIEMLLFSESKPSAFRGNLISAIFVLSAALIAITLPKITTVFSIIGSTSAVLVSFVLPAAFYIHINTGSIIHLTKEPLASILLIGSVIFGVFATLSSILSTLYPELIESR